MPRSVTPIRGCFCVWRGLRWGERCVWRVRQPDRYRRFKRPLRCHRERYTPLPRCSLPLKVLRELERRQKLRGHQKEHVLLPMR